VTNIMCIEASKNLDVIEMRRFVNAKHFESFVKTHKIESYKILQNDLKSRDKIIIAKISKNAKKNVKFARFESVKEMREYMQINDLHFAISKATKREDKRFMLSKDNKIVRKVFVFDNDNHFVDDKYFNNRFVKTTYFDDFNKSTM